VGTRVTQMNKEIKGIQIAADNIDVLDGKNHVAYCTHVKELIIDFTNGTNVIITLEELQALLADFNL
jgi:hypothetical protein